VQPRNLNEVLPIPFGVVLSLIERLHRALVFALKQRISECLMAGPGEQVKPGRGRRELPTCPTSRLLHQCSPQRRSASIPQGDSSVKHVRNVGLRILSIVTYLAVKVYRHGIERAQRNRSKAGVDHLAVSCRSLFITSPEETRRARPQLIETRIGAHGGARLGSLGGGRALMMRRCTARQIGDGLRTHGELSNAMLCGCSNRDGILHRCSGIRNLAPPHSTQHTATITDNSFRLPAPM
jgi:hypothetical protein